MLTTELLKKSDLIQLIKNSSIKNTIRSYDTRESSDQQNSGLNKLFIAIR